MQWKSANDTKAKVRELQRTLYLAAKASNKRRFHALYDKVYRTDVMWEAWKRVKANRGSAGIDGMTNQHIVREYGEEEFVRDTQRQLKENVYRPKPVRRKDIPKGDGKTRPLGIPVIQDRLVQMPAKIVLEAVFEADFKDCSFGFRPKRSTKQAIERIPTRTLGTRIGKIEDLQVPRDRNGDFQTQLFDPYQRREGWLEEAVIHMYKGGMGTRDIVGFIEGMFGTQYSPHG